MPVPLRTDSRCLATRRDVERAAHAPRSPRLVAGRCRGSTSPKPARAAAAAPRRRATPPRWTASSANWSKRPTRRRRPVRRRRALGGYGRRTLCLHSDIDLLIVFDGPIGAAEERSSTPCSSRCGISGSRSAITSANSANSTPWTEQPGIPARALRRAAARRRRPGVRRAARARRTAANPAERPNSSRRSCCSSTSATRSSTTRSISSSRT